LWTVLLEGSPIPANPAVEQDPVKRERLANEVKRCLSSIDKRRFFETGQLLRLLVGEVLEVNELLTSPHYVARDFFQTLTHPTAGALPYTGPPARSSVTGWSLHSAAPYLGEHNVAIYADRLGIDEFELVRLEAEGVI
jgi:crotonobetainyl-CoA:carnitine CoA-transferase CaiB-like acyl-CoA transferase